ncbi:hypothetical protein OS493_019943 [Desmophyllum pertusum]|uniref:Uncharacterized protein n=1 Tax=Desmophyllum pertusum TaxID=174260 RepID=A0A9W9YN38_9CNID|nr:hypothetical protein OS493_019943 [Desmophyllum pertusum]
MISHLPQLNEASNCQQPQRKNKQPQLKVKLHRHLASSLSNRTTSQYLHLKQQRHRLRQDQHGEQHEEEYVEEHEEEDGQEDEQLLNARCSMQHRTLKVFFLQETLTNQIVENIYHKQRAVPNSLPVLNTKDADDLYFWISYCSWTYCEKCRSLVPEKLLPGFTRRKQLKPKMSCSCRTGRYTIPSDEEIPLHLLSLTEDDVRILRPFVVHCGDYTMHKNGYRERTGPFRISWSTLSVIEKIKQVRNTVRHRKLLAAYEVLLSMPNSTYGKFVTMQRSNPTPPYLFEIYSAERFRGIECALWPTLYYDLSLCESAIEGTESRESGKVAFLAKCYSSVADYHLNYELLHYQYDRWLFRTITGAINSGRITGCSPALSLQHKTFSTGYWQWQHRMLIDAVRQFGYPSFFITISPFEWTFPFPPWLQTLRQHTGCGPTDLPVLETIHIAHTLEQLVRGYLCGSNTARWRNHLFSNQQEPEMSNCSDLFL